jgi:methionyl-tRNA formyltransferase
VQWALIAGDAVTGISIMQTEAGLDTGPVRLTRTLPITPSHDAVTLMADLAELGAEALGAALEALAAGTLPLAPQDDAEATLAPRLTRDDGRIRWHDGAEAIVARHRGVALWPGSHCTPPGADAAVLKVHGLRAEQGSGDPGKLLDVAPAGLLVGCGRGAVRITQVQLPGRPRVDAYAYAQGARLVTGVCFG